LHCRSSRRFAARGELWREISRARNNCAPFRLATARLSASITQKNQPTDKGKLAFRIMGMGRNAPTGINRKATWTVPTIAAQAPTNQYTGNMTETAPNALSMARKAFRLALRGARRTGNRGSDHYGSGERRGGGAKWIAGRVWPVCAQQSPCGGKACFRVLCGGIRGNAGMTMRRPRKNEGAEGGTRKHFYRLPPRIFSLKMTAIRGADKGHGSAGKAISDIPKFNFH
jgi:hypothetical protein